MNKTAIAVLFLVLVMGVQTASMAQKKKGWAFRLTHSEEYEIDLLDIAFSPDSNRLLTSTWRSIRIWDTATGKLAQHIRDDLGYAVAYSNDGKYFGVVGRNDLAIHRTSNGSEVRLLYDNRLKAGIVDAVRRSVVDMLYSRDNKNLVTVSNHGVAILDAESGNEVERIRSLGRGYCGMALSPDGRYVAGAFAGRGGDAPLPGSVRVWDLKSSKQLWIYQFNGLPARGVRSVAISPDGKTVLAGWNRGQWTMHDLKTGKRRVVHQAHESSVTGVGYLDRGKRIVSGGARQLRIWDSQTQELLHTLDFGALVTHVAVSPNQTLIAAAGRDLKSGYTKIWQILP